LLNDHCPLPQTDGSALSAQDDQRNKQAYQPIFKKALESREKRNTMAYDLPDMRRSTPTGSV
jgi:hypothetical protein